MNKNNPLYQHKLLHEQLKRFQGYSITKHRQQIKRLIDQTNSTRILDYGCGKGMQYLSHRIHEFWNIPLPYCYDPCIPALGELPDVLFDGVVCVDVMEHIEEQKIDKAIDQIFKYAKNFVYFNIATVPSRKSLPNGENAHVTIKNSDWWLSKIGQRKGVIVEVNFN